MTLRFPHACCPGRMSAPLTRREMLQRASAGFGLTALSAMMADGAYAGLAGEPACPFPPKAKNVIFLFMAGGVSHVDTFDPKPALEKVHGQPIGELANAKLTQLTGNRKWKQSPWGFQPYGQSGIPVSGLIVAGCGPALRV